MAFILNSRAFGDGDAIPRQYTQDGDNVSPPLEWREPPPGTQSFALFCEGAEPAGMPRCHWVVYDIPAGCAELAEGSGNRRTAGVHQAVNAFGKRGYDGPVSPEPGERRTYRFRLATLDVPRLDLPTAPDAAVLWRAAEPHVIREAELVATYGQALPATERRPAAALPEDRYGHTDLGRSRSAPLRERRQPDKGEPVVVAGDAGGAHTGRNPTTADLDRDAGKPPPNVLEPIAYEAERADGKKDEI